MEARRDPQLIGPNGQRVDRLIAGVTTRDILSVPYDRGVMTEMYRPEWDPSGTPVLHIHQVRLLAGVVSAWHVHKETTDKLFVTQGHLRLVLFDDREACPTCGQVDEFYLADARPCLVVIPAGVWHGMQNVGSADCFYLNFASQAYDYEHPDHYRLPSDTPRIPCHWEGAKTAPRPPRSR